MLSADRGHIMGQPASFFNFLHLIMTKVQVCILDLLHFDRLCFLTLFKSRPITVETTDIMSLVRISFVFFIVRLDCNHILQAFHMVDLATWKNLRFGALVYIKTEFVVKLNQIVVFELLIDRLELKGKVNFLASWFMHFANTANSDFVACIYINFFLVTQLWHIYNIFA